MDKLIINILSSAMVHQGDNNFMRYVYRGEESEWIPWEATHITVAEDCTFVRAHSFYEHPNIVEVICHENVKKIEEYAFSNCPNLRRVIMPGVKIVETMSLQLCPALIDVECGKLEIIKEEAFHNCTSLMIINLTSARIVEMNAFSYTKLSNVKFGSKLERIEGEAFGACTNLERITIPLKDNLIIRNDTFIECAQLKYVDLVERALDEISIAALQLEEWRNDMNDEIDSINHILPDTWEGQYDDYEFDDDDPGQKAEAIRRWIRSVLGKINHYKAEHERLLNEAVSTLQHALPHDILMNNVLPFLALPSHTFEEDDHVSEEDDSDDE